MYVTGIAKHTLFCHFLPQNLQLCAVCDIMDSGDVSQFPKVGNPNLLRGERCFMMSPTWQQRLLFPTLDASTRKALATLHKLQRSNLPSIRRKFSFFVSAHALPC